MGKKVKSALCSSGWCVNHLFELLPLKNTDCHYRRKMKLRLCPKLSAAGTTQQTLYSHLTGRSTQLSRRRCDGAADGDNCR